MLQCYGTYDSVQNVDFNVALVCRSSVDSNHNVSKFVVKVTSKKLTLHILPQPEDNIL
jgi:hypothetical protein